MVTTALLPLGWSAVNRSFGSLLSFWALAGAAFRCAASVESGRKPEARDLATLGIGEILGGNHYIGR